MAGADKGPGRNKNDNNGDQDTSEIRRRLNDLEGELGRARARQPLPPSGDASERGAALGMAFRLATELVAGVAVGGFIGWVLDGWFGTKPLMLVAFLLLGSAAGILNVVRTAKAMQDKAGPLPGADLPPDRDDDD
jgi:ATP synthase protein I